MQEASILETSCYSVITITICREEKNEKIGRK